MESGDFRTGRSLGNVRRWASDPRSTHLDRGAPRLPARRAYLALLTVSLGSVILLTSSLLDRRAPDSIPADDRAAEPATTDPSLDRDPTARAPDTPQEQRTAPAPDHPRRAPHPPAADARIALKRPPRQAARINALVAAYERGRTGDDRALRSALNTMANDLPRLDAQLPARIRRDIITLLRERQDPKATDDAIGGAIRVVNRLKRRGDLAPAEHQDAVRVIRFYAGTPTVKAKLRNEALRFLEGEESAREVVLRATADPVTQVEAIRSYLEMTNPTLTEILPYLDVASGRPDRGLAVIKAAEQLLREKTARGVQLHYSRAELDALLEYTRAPKPIGAIAMLQLIRYASPADQRVLIRQVLDDPGFAEAVSGEHPLMKRIHAMAALTKWPNEELGRLLDGRLEGKALGYVLLLLQVKRQWEVLGLHRDRILANVDAETRKRWEPLFKLADNREELIRYFQSRPSTRLIEDSLNAIAKRSVDEAVNVAIGASNSPNRSLRLGLAVWLAGRPSRATQAPTADALRSWQARERLPETRLCLRVLLCPALWDVSAAGAFLRSLSAAERFELRRALRKIAPTITPAALAQIAPRTLLRHVRDAATVSLRLALN